MIYLEAVQFKSDESRTLQKPSNGWHVSGDPGVAKRIYNHELHSKNIPISQWGDKILLLLWIHLIRNSSHTHQEKVMLE